MRDTITCDIKPTCEDMIKEIRDKLLVESANPHPITFADIHDELRRMTGEYSIDSQLSYEAYYSVLGLGTLIDHATSTTFVAYPNYDYTEGGAVRVYRLHIKGDYPSQLGTVILVGQEMREFVDFLRSDYEQKE